MLSRLALSLAILLAPPVAAAAQFTFTIPYKAQKLMPNVKELKLICAVWPTKPSDVRQYWGGGGFTEKSIPVGADGSAAGTATVGVDVKPGNAPGEMKYYACAAHLSDGGKTWGLIPQGATGYDAAQTSMKAAPGTPLVTHEEGWLPGKAPK